MLTIISDVRFDMTLANNLPIIPFQLEYHFLTMVTICDEMEILHIIITLPDVPNLSMLGSSDLFLMHKLSKALIGFPFSRAFY